MTSTTTRAAICRTFGAPLYLETVQIAAPGPGEVRVAIKACAICHSDLSFIAGDWSKNGEADLPAVYGHEAAGIVESIGDDVSAYRPGDRVAVTLIRACGQCRYCQQGADVACETVTELDRVSPIRTLDGGPIRHGLRTGAFAELAVVDQSQIVAIPDGLPFPVASLMSCGVLTGFGAVTNTAAVPAGASVAVVGCGGVGINSVQAARLAGADPVIAIDVNDSKLAFARQVGASHGLRADQPELAARVRAATNGQGADFVFVSVGLTAAIEQGLTLLAPMGALVLVGMPPSGVTASFDPEDVAGGNQRILGSKMGTARISRDIPKLISLYQSGKLAVDELITATFPFDAINKALDSARGGDTMRNVLLFD
ncbi:MAG: zinc-binding dehydrogenase [Alphaproteobacteria bacterium]